MQDLQSPRCVVPFAYQDPSPALTRLGMTFTAGMLAWLGAQACLVWWAAPWLIRPGRPFVALVLANLALAALWRGGIRLKMRRQVLGALRVAGEQPSYRGTLRDMTCVGGASGWAHLALQVLPLLTTTPSSLANAASNLDGPILSVFSQYLGLRHRLQYTSFAGHRFDLHGPFCAYFMLYLRRLMWAIVSLGWLYPEFAVRTRRMLFGRIHWAGHAAHYNGCENEVRQLYLRGALYCVLSAGLYIPWHLANLRNYHVRQLSLAGIHLISTQDGKELSVLMAGNVLALVFTLGLAWGWVVARNLRYQLSHLRLEGALLAPNLEAAGALPLPCPNGISDLLSSAIAFEF